MVVFEYIAGYLRDALVEHDFLRYPSECFRISGDIAVPVSGSPVHYCCRMCFFVNPNAFSVGAGVVSGKHLSYLYRDQVA
jgi:uncharacterized membrane protein